MRLYKITGFKKTGNHMLQCDCLLGTCKYYPLTFLEMMIDFDYGISMPMDYYQWMRDKIGTKPAILKRGQNRRFLNEITPPIRNFKDSQFCQSL